MHPIKQGGIEAAVIVAPGASIKGSAYVPLVQTLQNVSPLKLWVVIMDNFLIGAVNPAQLPQAINMAIKSLRQAGFKSDNIFLAGHSLGGAMTAMHASSDSKLKGAILFAAYLTNGNHLKDYPIPVLTISGDLDGLTRITRIVSSFEDLEDSIQKASNSLYRTPVIVMPGVNHAQFATGDMPSNVKQHDLPSDSTEGEAHMAIAKYTSAFLNSIITGVDQKLVKDAKKHAGKWLQ
ncbi:hypothetical protein FSP39_000675 [Pinctada imbricata]|uniref:Alpha/beta hydrolase fold-5 domain-containing protein n=1 Tax=Pinctada imbricata TaxID=66713 RepID=A0AA88Y957_PINIB|nr:hypothetical protein FSP39_000675 [Pinctada imbricata]